MNSKKLFSGFLALVMLLTAVNLAILFTAQASGEIYVSSVDELQSSHPYSSNMNTTWIYTHPEDCDMLGITFSEDTYVEYSYDYIYIYGEDDEYIGEYTGSSLAGEYIEVYGNVVKIQLTTDYSVEDYGFKVTNIQSVYSSGPITTFRCTERSENEIQVAFPKAEGATNVRILQSTNGSTWSVASTEESLDSNSTYATITNLSMGVQYYFKLSVTGGTRSGKSNTITVTTVTYAFNDDFGLLDGAVYYIGPDVDTVTIPSTIDGFPVTAIADEAFAGYGIESVTIPSSVTEIGGYAFADCYNLTSITIPSSVTQIGEYAFVDCYNLTSVVLPENLTCIPKAAFRYCENLTSINIPSSVTEIGDYAFEYCCNLTSITIPSSVTQIGEYAFVDCYNLTSVVLPENLTYIQEGTFCGCFSLTSINIPSSVTEIGEYAFVECYNLTSITIPSSVTQIEYGTFLYCESLTSITIPLSVVQIDEDAFYYCNELTDVYYAGSGYDWADIDIDYGNNALLYATKHYAIESDYVEPEYEEPTDDEYTEDDEQDYNPVVVYVSTVEELQSAHNYSNYLDKTWVYTYPQDADSIAVTFSYDTYVESNWDYIYIYDGSDNLVGSYTGAALADETVIVDGNVIKIRLITDESVTNYGFRVTDICDGYYEEPSEDDYTEEDETEPEYESAVVYVSTIEELQSAHNYSNDLDKTWVYTYPQDADSIAVTFSYDTYVESSYDYIYIYDGSDNLVGRYTSTALADETVTVDGNVIKIRLITDGSVTKYGFRVTDIQAYYSEFVTECAAEAVNGYIVIYAGFNKEITTEYVVVALYSSDNVLIETVIVPVRDSYLSTNVVMRDNSSADYAKVFLLDDITNLTPLANAVTAEIIRD